MDRLLVRSIPRPSHRSVFVGDVVAFNSPLSPSSEQVRSFRVSFDVSCIAPILTRADEQSPIFMLLAACLTTPKGPANCGVVQANLLVLQTVIHKNP